MKTGLKLRRDATAEEKREYQRAYSALTREHRLVQRRGYYARRKEVFSRAAKKYEAANRTKVNAARRRYLSAHQEKALLIFARSRAKRAGIPFNLVEYDIVIPDICPVLGIPLVKGIGRLHYSSPTLDKRVPELGYVKGNIAVISWRANMIKHNATPEELRAVADWVST